MSSWSGKQKRKILLKLHIQKIKGTKLDCVSQIYIKHTTVNGIFKFFFSSNKSNSCQCTNVNVVMKLSPLQWWPSSFLLQTLTLWQEGHTLQRSSQESFKNQEEILINLYFNLKSSCLSGPWLSPHTCVSWFHTQTLPLYRLASIHGSVGWRSTLFTRSDLAVSLRFMSSLRGYRNGVSALSQGMSIHIFCFTREQYHWSIL